MRISLFCHSLLSDWNHGNAHFLRGVVCELARRGHDVTVYEPADSWSLSSLRADARFEPTTDLIQQYPELKCVQYKHLLDLERVVDFSDLVLVHEWTSSEVVREIARLRRRKLTFVAFFFDSHHRLVTAPGSLAECRLDSYDAILAFGRSLAELYRTQQINDRVLVWHEAADTTTFLPLANRTQTGDLVWIGNWGDGERSAELLDFFVSPVRELKLRAATYGVRYPPPLLDEFAKTGISYRGWLANYKVPEVFAQFALTMHIPRAPYRHALPGIPTIRIFEAIACGIPLISAFWDDRERLFDPCDFVTVHTGDQMRTQLQRLIDQPEAAIAMARRARETVLRRHTCAHRVTELLRFYSEALQTSSVR